MKGFVILFTSFPPRPEEYQCLKTNCSKWLLVETLLKFYLSVQAFSKHITQQHLTFDNLKALVRRAQLFEDLDKPHESMNDYQEVLKLDPRNIQAKVAVETVRFLNISI